MRARRVVLAVVAAGIAGWLLWRHAGQPRPGAAPAVPTVPAPASTRTGAAVGPAPAPPGSTDGASRLVDGLNSPSGDIHADLRMIDQVFIAYRGATHEKNPIGENAEITAVLTGRNKLGFAFIPPSHPAINAKGELCDRWGTPFFFHQLSGERMEIRSAGPDGKPYTADDEVLTP